MKKILPYKKTIFIVTACLIICARQQLKGQTIKVYEDSVFNNIQDFTLIPIDSVKESVEFKNIPEKWTSLIKFEYNLKTYQIPLNSSIKTISITPNHKAEGFCNKVIFWTACDAISFYEHGNGCSEMNEVIFNRCNWDKSILIDGSLRKPFYYKDYKESRKRKKRNSK